MAFAVGDAVHGESDEPVVTFGQDDVYKQSDAAGFIRLFGLSARVRALKDQELAEKGERPAPAEAATEIAEDAASAKLAVA